MAAAIGNLTPNERIKAQFMGVLASPRNRTPLKAVVQSPIAHLLSPNDDRFEKEQARTARAMAHRLRRIAVEVDQAAMATAFQEDSNILSRKSLNELLNRCLKLAAENKINQGNTWDLNLIDHLSDLVKSDNGNEIETNFQQASCTLEAGVKIYSHRVDSVHTEAFKVLGALGRTAIAESETNVNGDNGEVDDSDSSTRISGLSKKKKTAITLESSYEALNVKKFDVTCSVDPLFNQTSAQFDEGGAKGLLLNTLSVYCGCEIIFDSFDIPEKRMKEKTLTDAENSATLDLSFMQECIKRLQDVTADISPTLREILKLIDDPRREAAEAEAAQAQLTDEAPKFSSTSESWLGIGMGVDQDQSNSPGDLFGSGNNAEDDHVFGGFDTRSPDLGSFSVGEDYNEDDGDVEGLERDAPFTEDPAEWLAVGIGLPPKSNAWAGPDHWKYTKPKDDTNALKRTESENPRKERTTKGKKGLAFSIDFQNLSEVDLSAFLPPEDRRSTILSKTSSVANTSLPEDCHYIPSNLWTFFLRPSVQCVPKKGTKKPGQYQMNSGFQDGGMGTAWDGDAEDMWNEHSDVEDSLGDDLIAQPRKVPQIGVTYDKSSKQVDVRILKKTLWEQLQFNPAVPQQETGVSFQKVLKEMPCTGSAAAAAGADISVHLCFICLLHLANEHNLYIEGCSTMDDLTIHLQILPSVEVEKLTQCSC